MAITSGRRRRPEIDDPTLRCAAGLSTTRAADRTSAVSQTQRADNISMCIFDKTKSHRDRHMHTTVRETIIISACMDILYNLI